MDRYNKIEKDQSTRMERLESNVKVCLQKSRYIEDHMGQLEQIIEIIRLMVSYGF